MVTTVHMQSQNCDDDQPKLIHTVLDFWEFRGSHTASGICSRLKKVFDKYGILDKIIAGTTDSGANVKKAIDVLLKEHIKNLIWLPCLAHRIHLVVCNGLGLWKKCKTESSETDEEYDSTAEENPDMESSANDDSEGGSDLEVESDYQDSVDNEEDIEQDAWGSENIQNRESDWNQVILSTALKKVRRTVNFFSRSSRWIDVLRKKITSSKTAIHKRIPQPDCKTRWNSTYEMLSNYLEHKEVVNDVLGEVALQNREMMNKVESLTLTRREIDAINQLCTLLQPFKKMTIVMSGSNYATVSMAMAFIKAMNEACSPKDDDAEITRALKAGLNEQLNSYFYDEGTSDIKKSLHVYKEAAYLDPRYHTSLTKSECKVVEIALKRSFMSGKECEIEPFEKNAERKKSHFQTNTDAQTSSYVTLPSETKAFDALDDLLESVGLSLSQEDGESDEDEFQTFKSLRATFKPREETSLGFWKRYEHVLPDLANRALKILCIPLTSIASESAFSQSSYIVRKQRVRLGGNVVGKLMFLKDKV